MLGRWSGPSRARSSVCVRQPVNRSVAPRYQTIGPRSSCTRVSQTHSLTPSSAGLLCGMVQKVHSKRFKVRLAPPRFEPLLAQFGALARFRALVKARTVQGARRHSSGRSHTLAQFGVLARLGALVGRSHSSGRSLSSFGALTRAPSLPTAFLRLKMQYPPLVLASCQEAVPPSQHTPLRSWVYKLG